MNEITFTPKSIATLLENNTCLPVILCIGTDKVIGDALGPIVGEMLVNSKIPAYVYGTLTTPVTALNLKDALRFISVRHPSSTVIAVDSSVGPLCEVGKTRFYKGSIKPGLATGKVLPYACDLSVTLTVASSREENPLGKVRLGFIYQHALTIAKTIHGGVSLAFSERKIISTVS